MTRSASKFIQLGDNARNQGHLSTAAEYYKRALKLEPNEAVQENLGAALVQLGQAQAGYDLLCDLTSPTALSNKGLALARLNRYPESIAVLRNALHQNRDAVTAINLGLSLLTMSEYTEGFAFFEARLLFDQTSPPWEMRWDGKPTDTLVVMHEQGFGDSLMMARYFPLLQERAKTCYLAVPPELNRLFTDSFPQHIVISDPRALPQTYAWCYVMSLPHLFGTTPTTIPNNIPYLASPPTSKRRGKPRIGYCHSGGVRGNEALAAIDATRFISQDRFEEVQVSGAEWVSLQYCPPPLGFKDFAETAALIATLDLVVSVDTAVFHLAAALGKPTWLLSRYDSCWRHRTGPWYPQVRQFRQPTFGDWDTPLSEVRDELIKWTS